MGRRAVVLVQTQRAQGADGKTDLLSEPHEQPVDLPPQLPETECAASAFTNSNTGCHDYLGIHSSRYFRVSSGVFVGFLSQPSLLEMR